MKPDRGFTLLELMIVIAIVGILAAATYAVFLSSDSEVRNNAFTLLADLSKARSEAVTRGVKLRVSFNINANSYNLCIDTNGDGDCGDPGDEPNFKDVTLKNAEFYDFSVAAPQGPNTRANGDILGANPNGVFVDTDNDDNDDANLIVFDFNGRTQINDSIEVYLYVPKDGGIDGNVMAVLVSPTGRIRIERWSNNSWDRK